LSRLLTEEYFEELTKWLKFIEYVEAWRNWTEGSRSSNNGSGTPQYKFQISG
jgi:hypothetical protein